MFKLLAKGFISERREETKPSSRRRDGFTLLEIIIVFAIIAILAAVILVSLNLPGRLQQAKVLETISDASALKVAPQLYFQDMGFYPPDVNRGADPGFTQSLPYFPDGHVGSLGTNCSHCPSNWQQIVAQNWRGPYLVKWPVSTYWGGKYDYNYWGSGTTRYGCYVPAGIYAGVQGNYSNQNTIPASAEQELISKGYDGDGCINGESQLILIKF